LRIAESERSWVFNADPLASDSAFRLRLYGLDRKRVTELSVARALRRNLSESRLLHGVALSESV
jgi:hypothetical protein